MQRVDREVTEKEMIEALNEIIDLIIDCYNKPLIDRFETRSTVIGKGITTSLKKRRIIERFSNIGWHSQRYLLEKDIIRTGGIIEEE